MKKYILHAIKEYGICTGWIHALEGQSVDITDADPGVYYLVS